MLDVLAIADDLTGALEAGAKFAEAGISVCVTNGEATRPCDSVVVVNTETRHLAPDAAARLVERVAVPHARLIYKKTDSTLRGNIRAELQVLADIYAPSRIAYIPAYPALGRTVRDGRLHIDGIPAHLTSFATDPLDPLRDCSVRQLVEDLRCVVSDGDTDADVRASVAAALADPSCRIVAGPASVAAELATQLDMPRRSPPPMPVVRSCLIVNGSLHPMASRQVEFAEASQCTASPWRVFRPVVRDGAHPLDIAKETARQVRKHLEAGAYDSLMVFGGDTAFAILEELGRPILDPVGEVVTGVPVARMRGRNGTLITKAGGFGGEDLICRVWWTLNAS